ncbi:MAG: hypothetical protein IPK14_09905 [Blastocatellia bacterium]|nr:hypothetical protein [Blastocatellia bacterium]MBN8724613.1 hypothetical protein [Acidobacteriota bacterium]
MFYILFIALALALFFVFRGTTQKYHSWEVIKERWFQVGLDNSLLFSSGTPQQGKELIRLDGSYNGYLIALSLLKDQKSNVLVEVSYPEEMSNRLKLYPTTTFSSINKILTSTSTEQETLEPITQEINSRTLNKRLHPQVVEQLSILRQEYSRLGKSFELTPEKLLYRQSGLLHDPVLLFPIVDEMVITVNLLSEHLEYLLVQ